MTDRPDSRRHPRFAVTLEAIVTLEGDRLAAVTKDMSRGGICLVCPRKVDPGNELQLELSLVLGTNTFSESLQLPARVVWCTPVGEAFQVGAVFVGLDRERTGYLEMFLRFLQQEVLVAGSEQGGGGTDPAGPFDTGDADKP